jgi:hypothetical protein
MPPELEPHYVEEISHALFDYTQIQRHKKTPNRAFAELIGALDKMNYQLHKNANIGHQREFMKVQKDALAATTAKQQVLSSDEPHYYFAHKWARAMSDFLLILRGISPEARKDAAKIYNAFYEGTDGDRL